MPDLLLLCPENTTALKLDDLCRSKGFRTKVTNDPKIAAEWLSSKRFSLVLLSSSFSTEIQRELSDLLWQRDPSVPLVVFNTLPNDDRRNSELKLLGAEVAFGSDALEGVRKVLDAMQQDDPNAELVSRFKIMVVDDLDSPRDIICAFVESLGFTDVTGVSSAKAAMEELSSNPTLYSCLLTDIRMPEIDGKALIDFVRQHPKLRHLPVIVLTAFGTVDCLIQCLKSGASGFLVKPPKRQDLRREFARAIRIAAGKSSPRLASHEEAETIREILLDRGLM